MSIFTLTSTLAEAWSNRFLLEITLTNISDAPLEGAVFDLFLDGAIDKLWRADWATVASGQYRVTMDRTLEPGEARVIGLTADGDPESQIGLVPLSGSGAPMPEAPEGPADVADPQEPAPTPAEEDGSGTAGDAAFATSGSLRKSWGDGFVYDVAVTNTGEAALGTVQVEVAFHGRIENLWNGTVEQTGAGTWRVTLDPSDLAPGETATFGFTAEADPDVKVTVSGAGAYSAPVPGPAPSAPSADPIEAAPDPYEPAPEPAEPTAPPAADPGTEVIEVAAGTSAADLQDLIDAAAPGTLIRLGDGTLSFDSTVELGRDGVAVLGAGSGRTIIEVDAGLGQEAFRVGDGGRSGAMELAGPAAEGDRQIRLDGTHTFAPGDFVYLSRENTDAFFDEIGDSSWLEDAPLRASIVEVTAVDGAKLTLASGLHFDFAVSESSVQEIDLVRDARLGGFTVDYGLGRADPGDFSNAAGDYDRDAVIQVEGTTGLKLEDIEARDVPSLGVNVALSRDAVGEGITVTGAHNKGSGGNGYALQLRDVYDSTFVGLSDMDMRHSVVFASWRSAVNNEVHVLKTDRDVNFHGGRDHGNVVRVDHSIRDAESDVIAKTLFVNTEGTRYGAPTDPSANEARFGHVVGTRLNDEVQGYDTGAWLDGAGGHDTLIGGDAPDVLVGGEGNDELIGGGGVDIALYRGAADGFEIARTGGGVEVDDRDSSDGDEGRDMVREVEWLLFEDGALHVADMSWHDRSAVDGLYQGVTPVAPGDFVDHADRLDAWLEGGAPLLPLDAEDADAGGATADTLFDMATVADVDYWF